MNHLLSNSIISRQQFGFRPQSSTQEALLAATNDWHQYLDSNLSVGCVAFDLSKAHDSLPHPTILSNLSQEGIHGRLLDWFQNYLSNRLQKVVLDGHESSTAHVTSGVPQGSILGPLLFTISMDPLTSLSLSKDSKIILYADDIYYINILHHIMMPLPLNRTSTWSQTGFMLIIKSCQNQVHAHFPQTFST